MTMQHNKENALQKIKLNMKFKQTLWYTVA